mgnify:CR=1 FL=1
MCPIMKVDQERAGNREGRESMQDKLMRCFYDGMSREEAVAFIERAYSVKVKDASVKTAANKIKTMTGKDW